MSIHNLLNNGSFAVRAGVTANSGRVSIADVVNEYNEAAAREGAQSLCLEDQLRASVAREEKRKMAHEDLYEAIEKRRSELLEDLAAKRVKREGLNAEIKAAQDALDMLPVPKTRRSKKAAQVAEVEIVNEPTMRDRVATRGAE